MHQGKGYKDDILMWETIRNHSVIEIYCGQLLRSLSALVLLIAVSPWPYVHTQGEYVRIFTRINHACLFFYL